MNVPLPEIALRDAVANEDWEKASEILAEHTLSVQRAFDNPPSDMDREAWAQLIDQQEKFRAELAESKTNAGQMLERLALHSRGAEAYRKGGL